MKDAGDNCQAFPAGGVVRSLSLVEFAAEIRDRLEHLLVQLIVVLNLHKHSTDCVVGGVGLQYKRLLPVWVCQYRGFSECLLQPSERRLLSVLPKG